MRSYAKLIDGSYVYSDISSFSIYRIAEYLYENTMMSTSDNHNYLYRNILTVVNEDYKPVDYNWGNTVVKP